MRRDPATPGSPPSHAAAVEAAVEAMAGTVALARALVEGGRRVDLDGLDRDAAALCAALLTLPPEQGRALRPVLEVLLRQIDALGGEIRRG